MVSQSRSNLPISVVLAFLMIGTALAMVPVPVQGEHEPDLTMGSSDIHFSESEPESGDEITIHATISNDGDGNASDVLVLFKEYFQGNWTIIGNRTIRTLQGGCMENVSIEWTAEPSGNHTIMVMIDPEDDIAESNERNNNAERKIVVKKESQEENTVLQGYTKKKSDSTHIPHVDIHIWRGDYSVTTESDGNGWYKIELEDVGWFNVRAERDGYDDFEGEVHVSRGKTTIYHIRMTEDEENTTKVVGHIYEKGTRGTPIHDAEVTLVGKSTNHSYTTHTDKDGYYEQGLEHAGNYTITAEKEGYGSETTHRYITEGEIEEVNFHLRKESSENETILRGYTKEKTDGSHIPKVFVRAYIGNYTRDTTSDDTGYYALVLEQGGNLTVVAEKDGYERYEETVHVPTGKETTHYIRMGKEEQGEKTHLHGYTREMSNGTHIPEVKVIIEKGPHEWSTWSDGEGWYEFDLEEGGNYTVHAERDGYQEYEGQVHVKFGQDTTHHIRLEEEGPGGLTILNGYTKEETRGWTAVPDVEITITGLECNCSYSTTTNDHGWYEIPVATGGNYTIRVSREGYAIQTRTVIIGEGTVTTVNFHLHRILTVLTGKVLPASRGGIEGVTITVVSDTGEYEHETTTDGSGHYEVILPHGGTYGVTASRTGYITRSLNITIEENETAILDFYLDEDGSAIPARERYGVDITAEFNTIHLEGKNRTVISMTITNTGLEDDTYSLSIRGSYMGWKVTLDGPDTVAIPAGSSHSLTLTLSEDAILEPEGERIVVDVLVTSETYPEVHDSVRIEGILEVDDPIPDLTIPLIMVSLGAGALVASFRRRH